MKPLKKKTEIILASKSARRKDILAHLQIDFTVLASDVDETVNESLPPHLYAELISSRKAEAVRTILSTRVSKNDEKPHQIIIASDTIVAVGSEILGKPGDRDNARRMLKMLSGCSHTVISGLTVIGNEKTIVTHDSSEVVFRKINDIEIEQYIDTGEPFDKAGGYGIQESAAIFVEKINGDYYNIVGLPIFKLFEILRQEFDLNYYDLKCKNT